MYDLRKNFPKLWSFPNTIVPRFLLNKIDPDLFRGILMIQNFRLNYLPLP